MYLANMSNARRLAVGLPRIKWSQVDLAACCIWMEGKRPNREQEPVAVPISGDMAKFLEVQPKESE